MTTFFCDYEGGNDANDGLTFTNRWKTLTSGATAARIAPGDTIKLMASPTPTSLGVTGIWTDGMEAPTFIPTSSLNATPIVFTKVGHGLVTGDTIIVQGHTVNTNANGVWYVTVSGDTFTLLNADGSSSIGNGIGGATGTVQKITNSVVKLASSLNKTIACTGNRNTLTNWTASANITCSINTTDYKEGGECLQIAVAAGFTTGLAAYITKSLDLSSYQQVSFWIKQTVGTVGAANSINLALCTDTAGVTVAHTINIPNIAALSRWIPITIDVGSNMSAAIQSVAFYINTDNGAQTFLIDNIQASKAASSADSLSLQSSIGKNTASGDWYSLQSINGLRLIIDNDTNCKPITAPALGYSGAPETVTTYKFETTKTLVAASAGTFVQEILDSGTLSAPITISGGWNRTDMSTQTGFTAFDGLNGFGIGIIASARNFINISKVHLYRYDRGLYLNGSSNCILTDINVGNTTTGGLLVTGHNNNFTNVISANNSNTSGYGVYFNPGNNNTGIFKQLSSNYNGFLLNQSSKNTFTILDTKNNANSAVNSALSANNNLTISASGSGVKDISLDSGNLYLQNSTLSSTVKAGGQVAFTNGIVWSTNEGNNTDIHYGYADGGLIASELSIRHTASGIAWSLSPTSANRASNYPLPLLIATAQVAANVAITLSVWFRRTNTGLTGRLVCYDGQLSGVSTTSSSMTVAADTWEQLSVTVTPTQKGVLEFYAECYGGTTYTMYVDDISIS